MKETFQEYTARMLSLAEGVDPLSVLTTTPARIGTLLMGRSPADLRWTPDPGRWSIAEIALHLADVEIVFAYRVRMILSAPGTPIQAFNQDAFVSAQHAADRDPFESLALMTALRTSMVRLLRGLTDEEYDRYGMHAERGKESIRHMTKMLAGHDRNHLPQIERLLAESGAAHSPAFSPAAVKPEIEPSLLDSLDVRIGTIRSAAAVRGADRLAVLTVDFGDRTRSIVAGIRTERPDLDRVAGVQALFVVNLPRKTIRGQVSEGMLFDIGFADGLRPAFAQPEWPLPDGTRAG